MKLEKINNDCYWHKWAKKKVEELSKEQIFKKENIIKCYICKTPAQCQSYLKDFYSERLEK